MARRTDDSEVCSGARLCDVASTGTGDKPEGRGVLSVRPHELRLVPAGQGLPGHVRQLRTLAGRTTLDVELSHAPLVVEVDIDNGEPSALPLRGAPVEIAPQRAICYPA